MTWEVSGSTFIAAPPERVWATLADFHRLDRWAPTVRKVEPVGPLRSGVGTARRMGVERLGHLLEVVTVWDEGERLGYRVSPLGPIQTSESLWRLESEDAGCRVHLSLEYELRFGGLGRLLHRVIARKLIERRLPRILSLLQRHVEGTLMA